MGSVSDICVRLAQLSDRDQLARLREALWPKSSAEEHARELALILEGKALVTMPLIILVAEASDRILAGFVEVDLRSHADGCNPARPVGYIEGLVRWAGGPDNARVSHTSRPLAGGRRVEILN